MRSCSAGALSPREVQVLELVAEGVTNREAASRLFISEAGIKTHLIRVHAKLDVRDRASAVAEAYRRGLLGQAGRGCAGQGVAEPVWPCSQGCGRVTPVAEASAGAPPSVLTRSGRQWQGPVV
ncbi:helix-turn-helix domain-containing protein [Sphaerisporangium flaviroseum]